MDRGNGLNLDCEAILPRIALLSPKLAHNNRPPSCMRMVFMVVPLNCVSNDWRLTECAIN
jgi:hypothetical protein